MKQLLKTLGIQLGVFFMLILGVGMVYAAWDDTVSTGSPLTAESWNTLIGKVSNMDSLLTVSGGMVGIGNTNPQTMLDMKSVSNSRITLENTGNNDIKIFAKTDRTYGGAGVFHILGINENNTAGALGIVTGSNPDTDGEIYLGTSQSGVYSEKMRITSAGNVGIGTSTPSSSGIIHAVRNTDGLERFILQNISSSDSSRAHLSIVVDSYATRFGSVKEATTMSSTWNAGRVSYIDFTNNDRFSIGKVPGTEMFTVTAGGNIGIGNSAPGSKLSVSGLPSGTSGVNAGLDGSSVGAVCIMSDGDMYIDTDGVCN